MKQAQTQKQEKQQMHFNCNFQIYLHPRPPQIINNHIPPNTNPPPPKPAHLALMRRRHRLLRGSIPTNITQKHQSPRRLFPSPFFSPTHPTPSSSPSHARQHTLQYRKRRIQHTDVFSEDVCRGKSVQRDRTLPPLFPFHHICQPGDGAVVEGDVVGVGGDAVAVEGDEDVDCGCGGFIAPIIRARYMGIAGG